RGREPATEARSSRTSHGETRRSRESARGACSRLESRNRTRGVLRIRVKRNAVPPQSPREGARDRLAHTSEHIPRKRTPMAIRILRALAVPGGLGSGAGAPAEPVQVEYFVAQKAFKAGVKGTDVLDFGLYADDQCTAEIGHYAIFANDGYAHFYVDKQQRI